MKQPDLANRDLWIGGYFEAAIVLGERNEANSDQRLLSALTTAWAQPALSGCYADRFDFDADTQPVGHIDERTVDLDSPGHLYGWLQLPDDRLTVAGTCVIREEFGAPDLDWLDLYVPLGGLAEVDERVGGYPFDERADCRPWLEPLSALIADISIAVCTAADARLALIGFEVSGDPAAELFDGTVPEHRSIGYVIPTPAGYTYHPPTESR